MTVKKSNSLTHQALLLEYITIVWNVFEGILCIFIGVVTGSVSLFAYGLEAGVEIFASSVVVWELKGAKGREKTALRFIGGAYIVVSLYIFIDAVNSFLKEAHPQKSFLGIIILIITICGMLVLGMAKYNIGRKLSSLTVVADAKFTLIDGALAFFVLVGLAANALFGWWWVDQLMALFLSGVAFREGMRELF
jgi:divalent metal cation (Fe/Co/Zn/Cd) transporter